MMLDYIPLLRVQRDLQGIPRGRARFRQYLRTMSNREGTDLELMPLVIVNPMGKDHVTTQLDELLALDADGLAARIAGETTTRLGDVPGDFKAALVVADDLLGGWTNRYACEFELRVCYGPFGRRPQDLRRYWVTGVLWSSEAASEQTVRETMLAAIYRAAYMQRHGPARNLRDMLAQEGHAMAMADWSRPVLDAEDLAYTREVLAPHLDA